MRTERQWTQHTVLNNTEFCGGCFSPDGQTFFVNQQGDRVDVGADPALETAALTYAIWGPYDGGDRDGD